MSPWIKFLIGLLLLLLIVAGLAVWQLKIVYQSWVASTSKGEPLFERALLESYGDKIIQDLTDKDVILAIVSRSGQPRKELPKGIQYTHSAFWLRNSSGGYDVHNLYHGDENRLISSLVIDAPADFLKLTREHDVGIIIPTPETQAKLTKFIKSESYDDVHQIHYSLISNPFDTRFQNCNEFMLDAMAAHFWGMTDREAIKVKLQQVLEPTTIEASLIRRKLGPRIDERLILKDQDKTIQTTTRQTLVNFLEIEGRLDVAYVLDLADG